MNSIIILLLRNDSEVCTYIIIIHTEVRGLKRLTWVVVVVGPSPVTFPNFKEESRKSIIMYAGFMLLHYEIYN